MVNKQPVFDLCSGGLETEQEYPYDAVDEKCKFKESEAVVYVNGSVSISKDETSELPLHNSAGLLIFRAVAEPRISTKSAKSREIHQNTRNPAKFARNLTK